MYGKNCLPNANQKDILELYSFCAVPMEIQIQKLRIGLLALTIYCLVMTIAMAILLINREGSPARDELIRTKGIVIEDSQGKPRILIGAPVPFVPERIRTDTVPPFFDLVKDGITKRSD